jgi:hypothetical protein
MANSDIPKWKNVPARPWDLFNKKIGRVPVDIAAERFEICKACPRYVKSTHQCLECGCIMNLKVKLPNAECPLGHWGQVDLEEDLDTKEE